MTTKISPLSVATLVLLCSLAASATCPVPSSPGVVICAPGNGQTLNYPAEITTAARGANGLAIKSIAIYVDSIKVLGEATNQVDDVDYGIQEGAHHLTVHAWDSAGHVYEAKQAFSVVGGSQPTCKPSSPGIRFCSPGNASFQPESEFQSLVGALGSNSPITSLEVSLDGYSVGSVTTSSLNFTGGASPGTHTETAKARDAAGHTYTATVTFRTYYDAVCSPYTSGCDPGIFITSPSNGSSVGGTFHIAADVKSNPAPITVMKAYLDGTAVATSSGPTLLANGSAAAGTHRLTMQAWDAKGNLYKTTETFTVK